MPSVASMPIMKSTASSTAPRHDVDVTADSAWLMVSRQTVYREEMIRVEAVSRTEQQREEGERDEVAGRVEGRIGRQRSPSTTARSDTAKASGSSMCGI